MIQFLRNRKAELYFLFIVFACTFCCVWYCAWKGQDGNAYRRVIESDGKGYYRYLPDIFINKKFRSNEADNRFLISIDGGVVNKYCVGTAICIAPFFATAALLHQFSDQAADGYSPIFQRMVSLAALLYLLVGLFFLILFLQECGFSTSVSILVTSLILFGTNLLVYTVLHPSFSHVYSFCFVSVFLFYAKKYLEKEHDKHALLAALAFGVIVLIRPVNGIVLFAIPSIANHKEQFIQRFKSFVQGAAFKVCFIIVFGLLSIQSLAWYAQCGRWVVWTYQHEGFYFTSPAVWNVLFSFRKGFFVYTPLALFSLSGLYFIWKKTTFNFYAAVLFLILLVWLIASWWNWYYGPSFSQRPFVEFLPFFGLLLAFSLEKIMKPGYLRMAMVLPIVFVFLNLIQSFQYSRYILLPENMSFEKYAFVFLKTGADYAGCLGGDDDQEPYRKNKAVLVNQKFDYEMELNGWNRGAVVKLNDSHQYVNDFSDKEFNSGFSMQMSEDHSKAFSLYAEINLEKMDIKTTDRQSPLFVATLTDSVNGSYYYYTFPLNEYPYSNVGVWRNLHYSIQIPKVKHAGDKLMLYVWNIHRQFFYLDNFELKLSAIY